VKGTRSIETLDEPDNAPCESTLTITVSSCIFIGTGGLAFGYTVVAAVVAALVAALIAGPGLIGKDKHHCSIRRLFCAGTIEIRMAIFTSPSELVSHHCASILRRVSDLESPASKVIVG
jgi:hypothetical protein